MDSTSLTSTAISSGCSWNASMIASMSGRLVHRSSLPSTLRRMTAGGRALHLDREAVTGTDVDRVHEGICVVAPVFGIHRHSISSRTT